MGDFILLVDEALYLEYSWEYGEVVRCDVFIAGHNVTFTGNPDWGTGSAMIIPIDLPTKIEPALLEEMARRIENRHL